MCSLRPELRVTGPAVYTLGPAEMEVEEKESGRWPCGERPWLKDLLVWKQD